MRQRARSAPMTMTPRPTTRSATSTLRVAIPGAILLLLSGCAGVGNYAGSMLDPFGNPNEPAGNAINMQRARGTAVAVQPIRPQPGDVWPGKLQPIPTLSEIQKHMNVPLGQDYQSMYGAPAAAAKTYSVPAGVTARRVPQDQTLHPATISKGTFTPRGRAEAHSSSLPESAHSNVSTLPKTAASSPSRAQPATNRHDFPIGQTLVGPTGPVGVISSASNGRYQTVSPVNGKGGGILIPNGNGTATLIQPNGQVVTVRNR